MIPASLLTPIAAAPVLVANRLLDQGIFVDVSSSKRERTAVDTAGASARGALASPGTCTVGIWDRPGSASVVSFAVSPGQRVFVWAAREFPTGRRVRLPRGAR